MKNKDILKNKMRGAPLRIGISTRALFDLEEEHNVFETEGVEAYAKHQIQKEEEILKRGAAFEVVSRLLRLNEPEKDPYVQIILLSRNSPDLSLRAFKSIKHHGLPVVTGSFTSGKAIGPYVTAWKLDLFLSNEHSDVRAAIAAGTAAATLGPVSPEWEHEESEEVRIAFDGDAVVFSAESDEVYKREGIVGFRKHEAENAANPMESGPFGDFLKKLSILREIYLDENGFSRIRIGIITARDSEAHQRVINTLRVWGTPADEAHFVGNWEKAPIIKAFGAHIFFDDQEKHIIGAAKIGPAGHVPGPHDPNKPIVPSE
ncbi:5'-nucleotidase [Stappia indica]|uniref:5'-nucleotidase n=1 Tax=Stappia indica TaxID=538381 RepID=A0A285THK0_9HYPH|nr:5'-nucleotidase [Stappia indica]SOC21522.1 5'-nucleotidase [Stappia indica]